MAMIKCPECGKGISDRAKSCPNCGFPISEISSETVISSNTKSGDGFHAHFSDEPIGGNMFYSYDDILSEMGFPTELSVNGINDFIDEREWNKLSSMCKSDGIIVSPECESQFKEMLSSERLIYKSEKNNDKTKIEKSIPVEKLSFLGEAEGIYKIPDIARFVIDHDFISAEIGMHTRTAQDYARSKSLFMNYGSKPMSAGTSALLGGVIAGTTGAVVGAALGVDKNREYLNSVDSCNRARDNFENKKIEHYQIAAEKKEELKNLQVPYNQMSANYYFFGFSTELGIIPVVLNDRYSNFYFEHEGKRINSFNIRFVLEDEEKKGSLVLKQELNNELRNEIIGLGNDIEKPLGDTEIIREKYEKWLSYYPYDDLIIKCAIHFEKRLEKEKEKALSEEQQKKKKYAKYEKAKTVILGEVKDEGEYMNTINVLRAMGDYEEASKIADMGMEKLAQSKQKDKRIIIGLVCFVVAVILFVLVVLFFDNIKNEKAEKLQIEQAEQTEELTKDNYDKVAKLFKEGDFESALQIV